jgi:hypothetical protein
VAQVQLHDCQLGKRQQRQLPLHGSLPGLPPVLGGLHMQPGQGLQARKQHWRWLLAELRLCNLKQRLQVWW